MLEFCEICPRRCKVNRLKGERGFCKTADKAVVYSYFPHLGEEPPISGTNGSGTIFFSFCNMGCVYCQNFEFSQKGGGKAVSNEELAAIMLDLQGRGCHNINFVTPTHVMPMVVEGVKIARKSGLKLPLVYNTSGYELAEMIKLLDGIIDVYLPDMRYADPKLAAKYSYAPDYPQHNQAAVKEMFRQVGNAQFNEDGIITRGMIIRHLVLPQDIAGTKTIMQFISRELSPDMHISLMSQYTPYYQAFNYKEINRRISIQEYEAAQSAMEEAGLHNGWTQEAGGLESLAGVHIKPTYSEDSPDGQNPE